MKDKEGKKALFLIGTEPLTLKKTTFIKLKISNFNPEFLNLFPVIKTTDF